jgi:PKD repeat protein
MPGREVSGGKSGLMRRLLFSLCAVACVALGLVLPQQAAQAAATNVVADWELNDAPGATVAVDSSGNGLNGAIDPTAATHGLHTGVTDGVNTFYRWDNRCPACEPVEQQRVVQIPDDDRLDIADASTTWTLEFRFRTSHPFGNYMQKGQSESHGGQIKVQGPKGSVQCLFKGADGTRVGTGSPTALDDNQWHTVQCIRTETQVKEFVDGVRVAVKNGETGPINNNNAFVIGGKTNCDQVAITCDYFSGDIDYVKVSTDAATGGNLSPNASFTSSCDLRECSFTSTSSDPDGSIAGYDWNFGDGSPHSTEANPTHTYTTVGDYTVALTVTDNQGATDRTTHTVTADNGAPPGAPQDAAATSGDRSATVTWSAPSSAGDTPIADYVVTTLPGGDTTTVSSTSRKAVITGLTNGTAYHFTVAAENAGGLGDAAQTSAVKPAGTPKRPTQVHATARKRSAVVTWAAADGNGARVLRYRVVSSNGRHLVVTGAVHRAVFKHLKTGSKARFRVRAINKVGAGAWSVWSHRITIK